MTAQDLLPAIMTISWQQVLMIGVGLVLIFIAIGAMIDFTPLFVRPFLLLFGAAAQFGIFATMAVAALLGFDLRQAASIGIIGAADGPTSIVVASRFAEDLLGPISVAGGLLLSLVPLFL